MAAKEVEVSITPGAVNRLVKVVFPEHGGGDTIVFIPEAVFRKLMDEGTKVINYWDQ